MLYNRKIKKVSYECRLKDYASQLVAASLSNYPSLKRDDYFKKEFGVGIKYLTNGMAAVGIPPKIFNKLSFFANMSPKDIRKDLLNIGYKGFDEISQFLEMPESKNRFFCERHAFPIAALICNDIGVTRDKIKYYFGRLGIETLQNMIDAGFAVEKSGVIKAYVDNIAATIPLKKPEMCTAIKHLNIENVVHRMNSIEGYISQEGVDLINIFSRNQWRINKIKITRQNQGLIPIFGFQYNMEVTNENNLKIKRGSRGVEEYNELIKIKSSENGNKVFDRKKLEWDLNYISMEDLINKTADIQVNISAVSEKGFLQYKDYCETILAFCNEEVFDNNKFKRDSELDGGIYYSVGFFTDYVLNF